MTYIESNNSDENKSRMILLSVEKGGDIIYDIKTGVEYWRSNGVHNYGTLTPLIDKDGKPLIYRGNE